MPKLATETIGTGDQSWLAEDGPHDAKSQSLLVSAFTANTHYPNGYFPSGLPVAKFTSGANSGEWGPYDPVATDGRQLDPFFVYVDTPVAAHAGLTSPDTHINVALIDRGRIYTNRLPVAFTPPADARLFRYFTQS